MPSPWTVLHRRTVIKDRWIGLHAEHVRTGSGAEIDPWYVVEAAHWVTMVPVLPDGRIILVEQYRHGAQRVCRELPAGNIDPGEDPAASALRELTEETGYRAAAPPIPLGTLWPEAARNRATSTGFLIHCQEQPGTQHLDASEDIGVVVLPAAEVFGPGFGGILHGTQLAFLLLARERLAAAPR